MTTSHADQSMNVRRVASFEHNTNVTQSTEYRVVHCFVTTPAPVAFFKMYFL